ncbi:helix-turn-helix domain-containing protein [Bombella sp. ESL0385]|nr:helix-turn-helix domain-containing protein [Bombella sp. ESL0385]
MMHQLPTYLSPKQFCEMYSVSAATLYRMIADGKIEARKIGRVTRISLEDAKNFFASCPKMETRGKYNRS